MILENILTGGASGLLGVVTGLVGNALTSYTNLKTQKLKNDHEIKMVEVETNAMIAETEANLKITEKQIEGDLLKAEEANYSTVLKEGNKQLLSDNVLLKMYSSPWTAWIGVVISFLLGFLDVIKGFMRPGLTIYLVVLTSYITIYSKEILESKQELMTIVAAQELFSSVTQIIIYLTVSTVTWWFADRRVAKFLYRLNDGNSTK